MKTYVITKLDKTLSRIKGSTIEISKDSKVVAIRAEDGRIVAIINLEAVVIVHEEP